MEVQNISGADIIPRGPSANPNVSSENVRIEKQAVPEDQKNPEENKGTLIDTRA